MSELNERFIAEAKKTHGDRYDYSRVVYTSSRLHVKIVCQDHGEFSQTPYTHLYHKSGCPKCAVELRARKNSLTTEIFLDKAKAIHGNRYDYSEVVYVNNHTHVSIRCPQHGTFKQTPNAHLLDQGCPHCGGKLKLSTEQFIANAVAVHSDKYDYSKSVYVTAKTQIEITCKAHGPFWQIPNNHTQGAGCPSCAPGMIFNTSEFVQKSRKVHGDKYDYSQSKFIAVTAPVVIGCRVHGEFEQMATEHLRGRGCRKCVGRYNKDEQHLATEEFISKAKRVHCSLYDYSESKYTTALTALKIICKTHGPYLQTPTSHLSGAGCSLCNASRGELAIGRILKKHDIEFTLQYRIPDQKYKYRYDFHIPSLNLLIEYHGIQHYEVVEFFGGKEGLMSTRIRDAVKKTLATIAGYKFLEVNYTQFLALTAEDFEKRLIKNLNKFRKRVQGY